jgi:hypothetical protein
MNTRSIVLLQRTNTVTDMIKIGVFLVWMTIESLPRHTTEVKYYHSKKNGYGERNLFEYWFK